jgi:hypothetical protein
MFNLRRVLLAFALLFASLSVGHVASASTPTGGWFMGQHSSTQTWVYGESFNNGDELQFDLYGFASSGAMFLSIRRMELRQLRAVIPLRSSPLHQDVSLRMDFALRIWLQ